MKNISFIAIPVFVVIVLFAGAFVWKMVTPAGSVVTRQMGTLPNSVEDAGGTKPANPFGFLFGTQVTPIPSPTPASAAAMNSDLNILDDDGGAADFASLQTDVSGL